MREDTRVCAESRCCDSACRRARQTVVMELQGQTTKYTYTSLDRCPSLPMRSRDDTWAFPLATSQCTSHILPWRQSCYFLPVGDRQEASDATKDACGAEQLPPGGKCQTSSDECSLSTAAFKPLAASRSVYFPFRKVIIGSKLIMLPVAGCLPETAAPTSGPRLPVSRSSTECHQRDKAAVSSSPPRASVGTNRDPDLPTTPPLGRSAWLNEFIEFRLKSGNMKSTASQPGCPFYPFWTENNHPPYQEIERRMAAVREGTNDYKTPMSHFKNDQRFLMNAVRNYKRDTELQKQACRFSDPKMFADVASMDWYHFMMSKHDCQYPLDARTESALLRSDFVRVHDGLGGSCYLDPKSRDSPDKGNYLVCPDTISSHLQPGLQPTVISSNKRPPIAKNAIECAIDNNLRALEEQANERDLLSRLLVDTEHALHDVKDRFYRLPALDRHGSDLVREMSGLQNCQIQMLNEIRCRERKMDAMMKYQHRLESQLTHHLQGLAR